MQRHRLPLDNSPSITAIKDGAIIRINLPQKGQHANCHIPASSSVQVFVGDEEPIIVSPLTTLLANGMSPEAVIQMLNQATLSGLTVSDLKKDPMATLVTKTGNVTESDLVLLQANMAVNAFMVATNNFNYGGVSTCCRLPGEFQRNSDNGSGEFEPGSLSAIGQYHRR